MKPSPVHLGFEIGTGAPVTIEPAHMAITGQTQQSGKTTTLEALVTRSNRTALTFITKRGEGSFATGRRVQPYFRDRADWQFVTSILDATLQEKNKFLRPWIIRICRTTKTLAEVQASVRDELATAKGINQGVYTQLDAYLDMIVPEIERADLAPTLDLQAGLTVMDVSAFNTPMQMLFIQSALDFVNEHCRQTIVVIPEAWEFVPEGKGSPVKASAVTLVRKGAGIGNHIWLDSQDMAGVDKTILRGCTTWLIGVQREANEIKRNLAQIPANLTRPKPGEVATLERGQFFACFGRTVVKTYVQPAWMDFNQAQAIARGDIGVESVSKPKEAEVDESEARALREDNRLKQETIAQLQARLSAAATDTKDIEDAEQRGFERGMAAGLRQAGEYWNAAMLDVRDAAAKTVALTEHLASLARDGRWSVPRGLAAPGVTDAQPQGPSFTGAAQPYLQPVHRAVAKMPKPARDPAETDQSGGTLSSAAMAMLDALVRSYPQALTPELWAIAIGNSPGTARSGPWHRNRNALKAAGYIVDVGKSARAVVAGIAASSDAPANPADEVALWGLWRSAIAGIVGETAMTMLRVLAVHRRHRLTNEQWALLCGKSAGTAKSGPWHTAIKALREWELIEGDKPFGITRKGLAVLDDQVNDEPPHRDTAEVLRQARRATLTISQRHYDALTRPMTRDELADALDVSAGTRKSGPWHSAIKELVNSGLVVDQGGRLSRAVEQLADAEPLETAA